ncbi:MAG TPA: hypothetical protein VG602_06040 [Actinomycetota bacterium]|nr:hypothetical protein [Actinomycetota bacterium]
MATEDGREPKDYQEAFARVEREVDGGNADLRALGFWPLVERVKRDPAVARHWAADIGRIDRKAFERRVRFRLPLWLGNLLLGGASVALVALVPVALDVARDAQRPEPVLSGVLVTLSGLGLAATIHDLAHWVTGRLQRIRFFSYYLNGPLIIEPAIKIDYESYMKAEPGRRALMHASGALASKAAPFAVFAAVYFPHRAANYDLLPPWSLWVLLGYGVLTILTDIFFSTKTSDWKKVRRERRLARMQQAGI